MYRIWRSMVKNTRDPQFNWNNLIPFHIYIYYRHYVLCRINASYLHWTLENCNVTLRFPGWVGLTFYIIKGVEWTCKSRLVKYTLNVCSGEKGPFREWGAIMICKYSHRGPNSVSNCSLTLHNAASNYILVWWLWVSILSSPAKLVCELSLRLSASYLILVTHPI